MEKIKVLSVMYVDQFEQCRRGEIPSQKMWGLYELSKRKDIDLKIMPFDSSNVQILKAVFGFRPHVVYLPFFDSKNFFLAFLFKLARVFKFKVCALCHFTIVPRSFAGKVFWRLFYGAMDRMMFFSPKSMGECVNNGFMKDSQCSVIHWGGDLSWIRSHADGEYGDYFVSTGKENRDFRTLIQGFGHNKASLVIFTKKENQGADYHYLEKLDLPGNIKILYPSEKNSYLQALRLSSHSKAYVIPLIKERIDYCVGWTSVVEAIALHKKIVSTRNPYYPIDIEEEGIGYYASPADSDSWARIADNGSFAYDETLHGKFEALANEYNIKNYAEELYRTIADLA